MTIVYFDYVQRSCSSLYRLPRFINCPTYITLHYMDKSVSKTCPWVEIIKKKNLTLFLFIIAYNFCLIGE